MSGHVRSFQLPNRPTRFGTASGITCKRCGGTASGESPHLTTLTTNGSSLTEDRSRKLIAPFPRLKADIGEDPARWLAPQTDMDPTPRIRGISEPEVAAAWLAVARRLGVDGDVRDKIKRRRDYLADREADQRGVDK